MCSQVLEFAKTKVRRTLDDAVEIFLHDRKGTVRGIASDTERTYKERLGAFTAWAEARGLQFMDEVDADAIDHFFVYLRDESATVDEELIVPGPHQDTSLQTPATAESIPAAQKCYLHERRSRRSPIVSPMEQQAVRAAMGRLARGARIPQRGSPCRTDPQRRYSGRTEWPQRKQPAGRRSS